MTAENLVTVGKGTSSKMLKSYRENKIEKLPVVADDGTLLGLITLGILPN